MATDSTTSKKGEPDKHHSSDLSSQNSHDSLEPQKLRTKWQKFKRLVWRGLAYILGALSLIFAWYTQTIMIKEIDQAISDRKEEILAHEVAISATASAHIGHLLIDSIETGTRLQGDNAQKSLAFELTTLIRRGQKLSDIDKFGSWFFGGEPKDNTEYFYVKRRDPDAELIEILDHLDSAAYIQGRVHRLYGTANLHMFAYAKNGQLRLDFLKELADIMQTRFLCLYVIGVVFLAAPKIIKFITEEFQ